MSFSLHVLQLTGYVLFFSAGTSVDWLSDSVDWIKTGISHLNVSMYNYAIDDLRADRDIVLPSYDDEEENWDDKVDEYPPHPPLSGIY